jgi:hypothetical protein
VNLSKYALYVLAATAVSQAALLPLLSAEMRPAVALGATLAALNVVLAFALAAWGMRRSPKAFLAAVLGGMAARMGLVLVAVVLALTLLGVPKLPLTFSLLAYFVPFLAFELAVLHRSVPNRAAADAR